MKEILRKPLVWLNIISLTFVGILIAGLAFGWNNPVAAPAGGSGAISVSPAGNVGIGNSVPGAKLDIAGNVQWSGTLLNGAVPWARLSAFPAACPAGQFVSQIGAGLVCGVPPSSSGVTGSGTIGNIAAWTGVSSLGNLTGTVTFPGDINVPGLITGSQTTVSGPQAFNSSGYWGGAAFGTTGGAWSKVCPAGQIMVGIGQATNGSLPTPYIICAPL